MNSKPHDVCVRKDAENNQVHFVGSNNQTGWFVSKPLAVVVALLLLLLVIGAVLVAYFIPTCSQETRGASRTAIPSTPSPTDEDILGEKEYFGGRLSDVINPLNYWVQLTVFLDDEDGEKQLTFDGELHFTFVCTEVTSSLTLHKDMLAIHIDTLSLKTDDLTNELEIIDVREEERYHFFIIEIETSLEVGQKYTLSLMYNGTLNQEYLGFYYVTYEVDHQIRYIAGTQLQTVFARRMFPCLDEPKFKAVFTIAVRHRRRRQAYSNMRIAREENHENDWKTSYFEPSPVMSTYLVAIVVADLECKASVTARDIDLRVCSIPEKIHTVDYSLNIGSQLMTYFDDIFGLPYYDMADKMDMVAIPDQKGAMENLGLIIYGESTLLYDSAIHTNSDLQLTAVIVVHEIAHQWFGNTVTCSWWSDLWLNEGFARYFEGIGLEHVEQDWRYLEQLYPVDTIYPAMDADSKSVTSHPIIVPSVGWPEEAEGMFDASITYSKGGCISTMMESFLGRETYFTALRIYLDKYQYTDTITDQLMEVLSQANAGNGDRSMKELMDPWLRQAGYPVVDVTRTGSRTFHADQEIFFQYKNDKPDRRHPHMGYKWHIPLIYTYQANSQSQRLLWMNLEPIDFELPSDSTKHDWILVNIDQKGYYRVNYDLDNWNKLAQQLLDDHTVFSARTRGALIADALNLAKAQRLGAVVALKLMQYLVTERDFLPWYTVSRYIEYTKDMLGRTSTYWFFQKFMSDLSTPRHAELGWDLYQGTHLETHSRLDALTLACQFDSPVCIENAKYHWNLWKQDPDNYEIRIEIQYIVFCISIRYGGPQEWNFAFERLKIDSENADTLLEALACSTEPWTLQRYLEYSLYSDELLWTLPYIRRSSGLGLSVAFDFIVNRFDEIYNRYNDTTFYMLFGVANYLNSEADIKRLESFRQLSQDHGLEKAFHKTLEVIQTNIEWMDKNHKDIHDWLVENTQQNAGNQFISTTQS
ncbi:aminopeptidase N-like [Saccoglossus kowalevskii]|uniref:Aminopeptidase n=1 Tax=Saccoglossus kowalevskii TaxID=10224 RepID=A0ABM0M6P6_SACKO|nr:PREDICTED: aminopeptidase N-like [Saccoglossus kowalevskii]